jgi:GNAT superfamily N-acetyltransferase
MTEARPITGEEADEFLLVVCAGFGLDPIRARDNFFNEPYFDLRRKWALFVDGRIVSTLTCVPIQFGTKPGIGIAGVSTLPDYRGNGYAHALVCSALETAESAGEGMALLFASEGALYKKCGFSKLDTVVSQPLTKGEGLFEPVPLDEVRSIYDKWSCESDDRLRRDDLRWRYWSWTLRSAQRTSSGYVCTEYGRVRELLTEFSGAADEGYEWFGLTGVAKELGVPLSDPKREMDLYGWNFDFVPQLFLTDQF